MIFSFDTAFNPSLGSVLIFPGEVVSEPPESPQPVGEEVIVYGSANFPVTIPGSTDNDCH